MNIKTEVDYACNARPWDDWIAFDDDTYDGPGSPLGHGRTEAEAIEDLEEVIRERAEHIDFLRHGEIWRLREISRDHYSQCDCCYCEAIRRRTERPERNGDEE